jgi:hypothetical protein
MKRIAIIILGFTAAALAQQPARTAALTRQRAGWPALKENMTKAQVRATLGPATGHFRDAYGEPIEDVYVRRTAHNTYEYRITYGWDMEKSQLHPPLVINGVEVVPDKMVAADNIWSMLDDLPEAARLCADGCGVYADGIFITVRPLHPTADQKSYTKDLLTGEPNTRFRHVKSLQFVIDLLSRKIILVHLFDSSIENASDEKEIGAWRPVH